MEQTRWYHIIFVGVIALAFVGFWVGTRTDGYEEARRAGFGSSEASDHADRAASGDASVRPAPSYGELMQSGYDKNPHWRDDLTENDVLAGDDAQKALAAWRSEPRSTNRAYGGAPPTVPHPINQRDDIACAACHTDGIQVGDRVGPPMSHRFLTNCTQCHAAGDPKLPFETKLPETIAPNNRFEGRAEATKGPRTFATSPPRIPHRLQMRSNCTSCHGPKGRPGPMSHEVRPNCRQCHVPEDDPPPFWNNDAAPALFPTTGGPP